MQKHDFERFLPKINKTSSCWIWTAAKDQKGYGLFRIGSKITRAHRLAYEHFLSSIPVGLQVLHKCDTPSCVNPFHLFLGTNADNMKDRKAKGRYDSLPSGEEHPRCVLSDSDVEKIRDLYSQSVHSQRELAKQFNVHYSLISLLVNNKRRLKCA